MLPVTLDTLRDTGWFVAVAVLIAAGSFLVPRERRPGTLPMAILAALMWGGLWLLYQFGDRFQDRTLYEVLREAAFALLAVAVMRSALMFAARVVLARFAIPSIVTDVLLGLGLIAYALLRLNSVGVNLAGIVTTSAVITGAIAFSAQEVLGALWAGVALQAERTIRLGDWIRYGENIGQVISIRWRATTILTRANELLIIPNAQLIRNPVNVLARGEGEAPPLRMLHFTVDFAHPPNTVVKAVTDALVRAEIPYMVTDPAPRCVCIGFADKGIGYRILYHISDMRRRLETDSEVYSHVFVALKRNGLRIPLPRLDMVMSRAMTANANAEQDAEGRAKALAELDLTASLTAEERRTIAELLVPCPYLDGDILFRQNEGADSLYILASGALGIYDELHGPRNKLATLAAPGYVGEMGLLTGQPRLATVIAEGEVLCYRLDKAGFDAVLRNRPQIVETLSQVLAQRQAANEARIAAFDASEAARRAGSRAGDIMRRIREFFSL